MMRNWRLVKVILFLTTWSIIWREKIDQLALIAPRTEQPISLR